MIDGAGCQRLFSSDRLAQMFLEIQPPASGRGNLPDSTRPVNSTAFLVR